MLFGTLNTWIGFPRTARLADSYEWNHSALLDHDEMGENLVCRKRGDVHEEFFPLIRTWRFRFILEEAQTPTLSYEKSRLECLVMIGRDFFLRQKAGSGLFTSCFSRLKFTGLIWRCVAIPECKEVPRRRVTQALTHSVLWGSPRSRYSPRRITSADAVAAGKSARSSAA